MQNIGEEIAGVYLNVVNGCDFVQYNLYTPTIQGEIDVVAINRKEQTVYICEVAIHLITGLQYVKNNHPDNVERLIKKFEKDIDYAEEYFSDHKRVYMLWSPIVKNQKKGAKYNQMDDVYEVAAHLKENRQVKLELFINERFQDALNEIRQYAATKTEALQSPILRLMQIEERLMRHLQT